MRNESTGTLESAMQKFLTCEDMTEEETVILREHLEGVADQVERESREIEETGVGVGWECLEERGLARKGNDGTWEWI